MKAVKMLWILLAVIFLFAYPVSAVNVIVGNWTFNQGGGNYANDTSGYNNNGTLHLATWSNDSVNRTSLDFTSTNDDVTIPASSTINISNTFSITGWSKVTSLSSIQRILNKGGSAGWEYAIFIDTLGNLYFQTYQTGGTIQSTATVTGGVSNNTWFFFAATYSNGSYTNISINNGAVSSSTSFSGAITPSTSSLYLAATTGGQNLTGLIDELKMYNYVLNASEITADYQAFHPVPAYPTGGMIITSDYPPQIVSINFSWHDTTYPGNELLVAEDSNFNVLSADVFTSNDFYLATLEVGKKYYWKVRQYNASNLSYGATSAVNNFTTTSTGGATGNSIQGVVYEIVNGLDTPITQATVYIYNTTWSDTAITGSNGYYLFSNLANGTYNLYAIKNGYDNTNAFPVTLNGTLVTNDILMKIYISPYVPNFVFETFIVRDLFDNSYAGVTVNVYKGDSLTASFTGTTDSAGQAVFQLIKDQRYRVTFSGGGLSSTITVYVYAKEEKYYVKVLSGFPTGGDRYADISTNLTPVTINASWANLSLIYVDSKLSTSTIWFYAKNMSTGVICYSSATSFNSTTLGCPVWSSGTYQFGFNATSSIYGFFQQDQIINFGAGTQAASVLNNKADRTLLQWGSIAFIIFVAALFSQRSVKYGAIVVPFVAFALWMPPLSTFEPIVGGSATTNFTLLACALVIGVMVYLRMSENKAAVSI